MSDTPFRVVRGTEAKIKENTPHEGYVFFATDTQKIYYGDGREFISMGGNSSIHFGILDTSGADDGQIEFIFDPQVDLEPTNSPPQIDDLILNKDGCFYRIINVAPGEITANRVTLKGGGGGGGGGSTGTATVEYIDPPKTDNTVNILFGQPYVIKYKVTSTDSSGDPGGNGTVIWHDKTSGDRIVGQSMVTQGVNETEISQFFSAPGNYILQGQFNLDTGGSTSTIVRKSWNVNIVQIEVKWDYNIALQNSGELFQMQWNAFGNVEKTSHIEFDDVEVFTTTTTSNALQTQNFLRAQYGLSHGVHKIGLYVTAKINNVEFTSNKIVKEAIMIDEGNKLPIIAIGDYSPTMNQYDTQQIPIVICNSKTAQLFLNDELVDTWEDLTGAVRNWSFTPLTAGLQTLRIVAGSIDRIFTINANKLDIDDLETPGYVVKIKASDFSSNTALQNNELLSFSDNFDWINGGLQSEDDENGATRRFIKIKSGTQMIVNYKLFENFNTSFGKNFKIIFKVNNCSDYDAKFLSCMSNNNVGLEMKAQNALYRTSASNINTLYCEDSYIEYQLDIWPSIKQASGKAQPYIIPWLDGVPAGIVVYGQDIFTQPSDNLQNIIIGSNDCDVQIYLIKVYEKHLSFQEHINNFIIDAYNSNEMLKRYYRNNILDERTGEINWKKLIDANPKCYVNMYDIDHMTKTKKDEVPVNSFELYVNDSNKPLMSTGIAHGIDGNIIKVQGTSSAAYGLAAFNLDSKFKKGMLDSNGDKISKFAMDENAIPVNYFTTKVNVASCEGANNALNQEWYNKYQPYRTAARKANSKKRDTMQFKPGVLFILDRNPETDGAHHKPDDGGNVADNVFKDTPGYVESPYYKFYSVCNFGNSKKNFEAIHDENNSYEICIEVTDNQNQGQWMTKVEGYNPATKEFIDITTEDINDPDIYNLWLEALNDGNFDVRYVNGTDGIFDDDGNCTATETQIKGFFRLAQWFALNDPSPYNEINHPYGYTEEELPEPITFGDYIFKTTNWQGDNTKLGGLKVSTYAGTYTTDCYEYRMAKLLSECEDYLIMDSIIFHYLFIERHTLIDNVAKNTFWTSEDPENKYWCLNKDYDNDTADGNDNSGHLTLTYGYEIKDKVAGSTDTYVFNAHDTVWLNFIDGLYEVCRHMYDQLSAAGAWSPTNYLKDFNDWQGVIPECCWVEDYYRKYIRPFEVYDDTTFLTMLEGGKKTHQRKQFETYQARYTDTKYQSSNILNKSNAIYIRGNAKVDDVTQLAIPVKMYSDCYIVTDWAQTIKSQRVKRNTVVNIIPVHNSMNDETIYWYAPDLYSSIGDVGVLQPKLVQLTGTSRLSEFSIGEKTEVPDLTSISFTGNTLLKYLTVKNCINLGKIETDPENPGGQQLDLRNLVSLRSLDTTGSNFTDITLPNNAPLQSIVLNNITGLTANNLNTIEELNLENYDNVRMLLLNNIDNTEEVNSLDDLFKPSINTLEAYGAKNVDWYINELSDIDLDNYKVNILEQLLTKQPYEYDIENNIIQQSVHAEALTGNLLIGKNAYTGQHSIDIYNNYVIKYPKLNLNFEDEDSKLYTVTIYNGNNEVIWQKKALRNTPLNNDFYSGLDYTKVVKMSTAEFTYTFTGKWYKEGQLGERDLVIDNEFLTEDISFIPQFNSSVRYYTIKLHVENEIYEKEVVYNTELQVCYDYLKDNGYLYKDDKDLRREYTYECIGLSNVPNGAPLSLRIKLISSQTEFYAVFQEKLIYDCDFSDYFNYTLDSYTDTWNDDFSIQSGYQISPKTRLSGKILIPKEYNNQPIIAFQASGAGASNYYKNVTHIFFNEEHELRVINQYCFYECTKLQYFDFEHVNKLRIVGSSAFQRVNNLKENFTLSNNLYQIQNQGFSAAFKHTESGKIFTLNGSITLLGWRAFAFEGFQNYNLSIGAEYDRSNLNMEASLASDIQYLNQTNATERCGIAQNQSEKYNRLDFYANNYSSIDDSVVMSDGIIISLRNFFGGARDNGQAAPETYSLL